MRRTLLVLAALAIGMGAGATNAAATPGDATRGAQLYRACAACHSLAPDRNMTGPSLAGVWGRKAGTLESFDRYSPALKASTIAWDAETLDEWLEAPARMVPDNRMTFAGISDPRARADLIAFLKEAGASRARAPKQAAAPGGMTGGGMAPEHPNLKNVGPEHQVTAIRYCRDTYHVTTADGKTADFWEANLRLKTDSGELGPPEGRPAILPAGMMGDRASLFFAKPGEISGFIEHKC